MQLLTRTNAPTLLSHSPTPRLSLFLSLLLVLPEIFVLTYAHSRSLPFVLIINCFFAFMPKIIPIFTFHLAWPGRAVAPPSNRALPWLGYLINPTLYSSPPTLWSGRQLFGNLTTIFGYANLQLSNQPRSQSGRQAGANQATNQLPRRALNSLWCAPFYSERSS